MNLVKIILKTSSLKVVESLKISIKSVGKNIFFLIGMHENMILQCLDFYFLVFGDYFFSL